MSSSPRPHTRLFRVVLLGLLLLPLLGLSPARTRPLVPSRVGGGPAPVGDTGAVPPASVAPSRPALRLSWPAAERVLVGVPAALTLEALDAAGGVDPTQSGTAVLTLDDPRAEVTPAAAGAAPLAGVPDSLRQRFSVPLSGGRADLRVRFAVPGRRAAFALLGVGVAGEATVQVAPTFLVLEAGGPAQQGTATRVTLVVRDERGQPVPSYARPLLVATSDPEAPIADPNIAGPAAKGTARRAFAATDQGRAPLDITFGRSGAQTIEVRAADDGASLVRLPLTVASAAKRPGRERDGDRRARCGATGRPGRGPERQPVFHHQHERRRRPGRHRSPDDRHRPQPGRHRQPALYRHRALHLDG
jgi:hypothetical protein